jgi:hypothetical protein
VVVDEAVSPFGPMLVAAAMTCPAFRVEYVVVGVWRLMPSVQCPVSSV